MTYFTKRYHTPGTSSYNSINGHKRSREQRHWFDV